MRRREINVLVRIGDRATFEGLAFCVRRCRGIGLCANFADQFS